jgi:hypothetical protein
VQHGPNALRDDPAAIRGEKDQVNMQVENDVSY